MKLAIIGSDFSCDFYENLNLSDYLDVVPEAVFCDGFSPMCLAACRFAEEHNIPSKECMPQLSDGCDEEDEFKAIKEANRKMIMGSDFVLALWDGSDSFLIDNLRWALVYGVPFKLVNLSTGSVQTGLVAL